MTGARPFLFENRDFGQVADAKNAPPEQRPQFSQIELTIATETAQRRGFEEGLAEATQGNEAQLMRLIEQALGQIAGLTAAEAARRVETQSLAIDIASELLRKLMPELANQPALEGISSLVQRVMMDRFEEPRLIIRVHDSVLDNLNERLKTLASQSGFNGQYALMADTQLAPTDCRIEWSNGGVERSAVRLFENMQISLEHIKATLLSNIPTANEGEPT